jgi:hypothetical protein
LVDCLFDELAPAAAAELSLELGKKGGSRALTHLPSEASFGGKELDCSDERLSVASGEREAAAGAFDRIGRLAVIGSDENDWASGSHGSVEFPGHDDPVQCGSHRDEMNVGD